MTSTVLFELSQVLGTVQLVPDVRKTTWVVAEAKSGDARTARAKRERENGM
jgi:hypothetical protein